MTSQRPIFYLYLFIIFSSFFELQAQVKLSQKDIAQQTIYFTMEGRSRFDEEAKKFFNKELQKARIVAIAEQPNSAELSRFTTGIVRLSAINDYANMALEIGPISAQYISSLFNDERRIPTMSKMLNNAYGIKSQQRGPLVHTDKVEDQWFLQALKDNRFQLWGLDQEYALSYEMHLDSLYAMIDAPSTATTRQYTSLKQVLRDGGHQSFNKGKSDANCNLMRNNGLSTFFKNFEGNETAQMTIAAMQSSWEIYCLDERGKQAHQSRADYMKRNFKLRWENMNQEDASAKLLMKFGNEHLTRGISPFGLEDLGKHIVDSVVASPDEILVIRHMTRFSKGKDLLGSNEWQELTPFLNLGKEDVWTLIDLRILRKQLASGDITAEKAVAYEINNYDLLVIPPNDREAGDLF